MVDLVDFAEAPQGLYNADDLEVELGLSHILGMQ